jgi:DNA invertase Pin-like site-specific DNA recombinase
MPAAQYLRMSKEQQKYSIANQVAAIQTYARLNGFEIVRTYSDEARNITKDSQVHEIFLPYT